MSQVLIPPTVGRVVWFYPPGNVASNDFSPPAAGEPLAAIISRVWNDSMVNLTVFDASGVSHSRTSVPLVQEDKITPRGFYCTWMPFQKGQARANAAETAAIATGAVAAQSNLAAVTEASSARWRADADRADAHKAALIGRLSDGSTHDVVVEGLIQAKGKTAPRVTPGDLAANIVDTEIVKHVTPSGQILRWAVLTTRSGFAVTGRPSAAVSAENDDPEIGVATAIENARNELWPLMGYALKQRLHDLATGPV